MEHLRVIVRTVCQEPSQVKLYSLHIDGSDQSLPSLGTLAELSPFTNAPRPLVVACTFETDQSLVASSMIAAVHYGIMKDGLRCSNKSVSCGHFTTPSLLAYIHRRLVFTTHTVESPWVSQTFKLVTEAATHFTFVLSTLLLIGTPVHETYGRGSYCSAFREFMKCQYGIVKGFHMQRMIPAILAAAYSGTLY